MALIQEVMSDKTAETVQRSEDWIAIRDSKQALWTIGTPKNPAYPVVVCRKLVGSQEAGFSIDTQMICDAPRPACEHAREEIIALNASVRDALSSK